MQIKVPILVALVVVVTSVALTTTHSYADTGPGKSGTGILYVYINEARTIPVQENQASNYQVLPNKQYWFKITDITEYENTDISVCAKYKIDNTGHTDKIDEFPLGTKPSTVLFDWTIPDLPITSSIKIQYGKGIDCDVNEDGTVDTTDVDEINANWQPNSYTSQTDHNPKYDTNKDGTINTQDVNLVTTNIGKTWYYAKKNLHSSPRLLLVIPEAFLGSIGATAALFAGLGITKRLTRKKKQSDPAKQR